MRLRLLAIALIGFIALPAAAQDIDIEDFERVLQPLPVAFVAGANGSSWFTSTYVHNQGATSVELRWVSCPSCPTVFVLSPGITTTAPFPYIGPGVPRGALVWVRKTDSAQVRFSSRIRDVSRDPLSAGTEIPVVREEDFLSGKSSLVAIPVRDGFRVSLRIYDPENRERSEFRFRFIQSGLLGRVMAEDFVVTTALPNRPTSNVPVFVPMAQIHDLASRYPLTQDPVTLGEEFFTIEIEPMIPDARYWAFVSITNNATQHVTLVTP